MEGFTVSTQPTSQRRQQREKIAPAEHETRIAVSRDEWIATAAYFLAERRRAEGERSDELQNCLDAEQAYAQSRVPSSTSRTADRY